MQRHIFYIILFLTVEFLVTVSVFSSKDQKLTEYLNTQKAADEINYSYMLNTYREICTKTFNNIINKDKIKNMISEAAEHPEKKEEIRKLLYNEILPVYTSLQSVNISNIHFHLKDSTSLLRLKNSDIYGDSLSEARPLVIQANEQNEYKEGFENGKYHAGYRYIFPINQGTEHLGTVEFTASLEGIVNSLNLLYGGSYKYIVKSAHASKHAKAVHKISDEYIADSCTSCSLDEKSAGISQTVNKILTKDFKRRVLPSITSDKTTSYFAGEGAVKYIITFIPIKENGSEPSGCIISFHKAEAYDKIVNYTMMLYVLITLIVIAVVICIAVLDQSRRKTQKINAELESIVKKQVKELRDKEQFSAQQAKMVTMGEMFSAIMHQWKQPITSISLIADMLMFECETRQCSEDIKKYIQEVKSQTIFMTQTGKDFSNFLRPSAKPEVFNVCFAISDIIRLFDFSFARYNTAFLPLWTEDTAKNANIFGYANEFKHVLLNLFNNARDAISAKRDKMIEDNQDVSLYKGVIKINVYIERYKVVIKVSDTGGGIPDSIIDNIFDQYFSTKKETGTGIGLYMTKNLVESNMQGRIFVKNITEGAEFTIECPLAKEEKADVFNF